MKPETNIDQAVTFLLGHASGDLIVVTAIRPSGGPTITRTFTTSQTDDIRRFLNEHQGVRNLYFTVNPVGRELKKKATKEDIASVAYFHVDCDPRSGKDRSAERDRILSLLREFRPPPTCIIDSGNGYQGFWRLAEALPNDGDYARLEVVNKQLAVLLGGDNCHNVDRIMRIPGTINLPTKRKKKRGDVAVTAALISQEDRSVRVEDFELLPERFLTLLHKDKLLRSRWMGEERGLEDTSRSGFDHSLTALLKHRRFSQEDAERVLRQYPFGQYAAERDPRTFERCWERAASGHERAPEVEAAIDEINKEFAVVLTGGKVSILAEYDHPDGGRDFDLLGIDSFRTWFKNRLCTVVSEGGKIRSASQAEVWLKHHRRREYREIVFTPGREVPGAYNLWHGFAVAPREGDCSLFLAHLRDNVCQGNTALFDYVIGWFAALVQEPAAKVGTALVLRGKQGTGKTIVGEVMGRLLGRHYRLVASIRYVTGRFNAHLKDCLLLQTDEAFWAGDHTAEGMLKSLITSPTLPIEFKGKETIWIDNHVRLLVTSNAPWVVPAGIDERRFVVLEVGTDHMQDGKYFAALIDQIENGGAEALLHFLLHHDYSTVDLRAVPRTMALRDQKVASLPIELRWLLDLLMRGALPGDAKGEGRAPAPLVYDHYVTSTNKVGARRKVWEMEVSKLLKEWIPGIKKKDGTYSSPGWEGQKRGNIWYFPPLAECRKAFEERTGETWDWEDRDSWLAEETDEM